jgi:uncharacterized repeat protein (TIGR03803 family)
VRNGIFSVGFCSLFVFVASAGFSPFAAAVQEQVLYRFAGGTDGAQPTAGLIADASGNLYGTTSEGGGTGCGGSGCGTVFELSPQNGGWSETVIYKFGGNADGADPDAPLIVDENGNLYGTTSLGGSDNCGAGSGCGTVFELSPQQGGWKENVLYSFTGKNNGNHTPGLTRVDVWAPNGLVFGSDGNLYGFASLGGDCRQMSHLIACYGGAFELKKPATPKGAWKERVIFRAKNASLGGAEGPPVFDANGNLYGLATQAGYGSVFMLKPPGGKGAWAASTLYTFQGGTDGGYLSPGLVFDANGNLYGATSGYRTLPGNVFELTAGKKDKWTETPLFTFTDTGDGSTPAAAPVFDASGNLYGAAEAGGQNGAGTIYELSPQNGGWTETTLYSFAGGSDGATPQGSLLYSNGSLYGVTQSGGNGGCFDNAGCGTVFAVVP